MKLHVFINFYYYISNLGQFIWEGFCTAKSLALKKVREIQCQDLKLSFKGWISKAEKQGEILFRKLNTETNLENTLMMACTALDLSKLKCIDKI